MASEQELALGMLFRGEARRQLLKVLAISSSGSSHLVTLQTTLPLAQEIFTRTVEAVDGEKLIHVTNDLESALDVDRPIS